MGQRSQLYVRVNLNEENKKLYNCDKLLVAMHLQYNDMEDMISRAAGLLDFALSNKRYMSSELVQEDIPGYIETNFDKNERYHGHDLVNEFINSSYATNGLCYDADDFYATVFVSDNNDGRFLLEYDEATDTFKYAFMDKDNTMVMSPEEYLVWDYKANHSRSDVKEWETALQKRYGEDNYLNSALEFTKENIDFLTEHAELLSLDEAQKFLHDDYNDFVKKIVDKINKTPTPPIKKVLAELHELDADLEYAIRTDLTKWYICRENNYVIMEYYNPDSSAGGSVIETYIDFEKFVEMAEMIDAPDEELFGILLDGSQEEIWTDKGHYSYIDKLKDYLRDTKCYTESRGAEMPEAIKAFAKELAAEREKEENEKE